MRYLLLIIWFNCFLTANSQKNENDSIYSYVFENEFVYGEVDNSDESLKIHFTSNKYLKMSYPRKGVEEFILMDNESAFGAIFRKDTLEVKKYSDMPEKAIDSLNLNLIKLGEERYKRYDCNIYEIVLGAGRLKLYFEKEPSITFNSFFAKFLSSRGININQNSVPNGKLVLIKDEETEGAAFSMELKEYSDNQQIKFTLKTGE